MAPEFHDKGNPYLAKPLDMWALGVTLYMYLYCALPFSGATAIDFTSSIMND